jgi:hypothetical protein
VVPSLQGFQPKPYISFTLHPCMLQFPCNHPNNIWWNRMEYSQSQWLHGLRRGSLAVHLLGLWVWILPGAWMSVFCECCVLGRGLCVGLITHPEESYRMCGVSECDREALTMRRPWPTRGCHAMGGKKKEWNTRRVGTVVTHALHP